MQNLKGAFGIFVGPFSSIRIIIVERTQWKADFADLSGKFLKKFGNR